MRGRRIDGAVVALVIALLIGGYLRLWDLTNRSLFLDEAFTLWVASKPWAAMMNQIVYHDFHPPVFYAVTHWLIGVLRWQPWDYRFLTAPFGLLTIVASWAIARRLFGDVAAGATAFLVALEPSLVDWDRVFRMYSVLTALCTTSWWLLLIGQDATGRRRVAAWLGYGAVAILLPYIQYLGAVTLVCQGAYALFDLRKRWPILASCGAAVLALVPWMWAIRIQAPHGGLVAGTKVVPIGWVLLPRDVLLAGVPWNWSGSIVFAWSVTVFVAIVAVVSIARWPRTIVPFWLGVAALQVIATLATGKGLVVPRYLLPALPGFTIAVGGLIAWLIAGRLRVLGAALAIALPAIAAVCSADIIWDPFYQFTDWYLVNLIVLQNEKPDDAMLFVQGFPYLVVGDFTAFRGHPAEGPAMPADLPFTLGWIRKHAGQRIWYIENQAYYADPGHEVKRYLDSTRRQLHVWSEARAGLSDIVNVILYDKQTKRSSKPAHTVRTVTR
ncbi:MAG TPA: glycosyltransferase family 39 protein [Candidatus Eremiobacteraceae bacterium]|nr:glycosyltransferase family 39 protein [Candidatus Eremiobacteraceae bacterium]